MDASNELLGQESARIEAHQRYAAVRYRTLRTAFKRPFRANAADGKTVELGMAISSGMEEVRKAADQDDQRKAKAGRICRELNITLSPTALRRAETVPALEELKQLLNEPDEPTGGAE
jgi:hypothetical protein